MVISTEAAIATSAKNEQHVLPQEVDRIFQSKCSACHSGDEAEAQLNIDTLPHLMAGSEQGAAIIPGKPQQSLLWNKIKSNDMPPQDEEQLTDAEKNKIRQWIQTGKFPSEKEIRQIKLAHLITEANKHWAFRLVKRQTVPVVNNTQWARSDIDRFVLARLEAVDLEPSRAANPYTLLRRIHYDLTGLPPDERVIQQFLYDVNQSNLQAAFEKVVDRLLDSRNLENAGGGTG